MIMRVMAYITPQNTHPHTQRSGHVIGAAVPPDKIVSATKITGKQRKIVESTTIRIAAIVIKPSAKTQGQQMMQRNTIKPM